MLKDKFLTLVATGLYLGKIPFAPGTWGSILGVIIWLVINWFLIELQFSWFKIQILWTILLLIIFILGVYSADFYCKKTKQEDNKEVVIDEIFGQIITFFIVSIFIGVIKQIFLIFLGFVFFRLFDITKPFVIGIIDKNIKGGFGVMLDDFMAGFAAAALLYGFASLQL